MAYKSYSKYITTSGADEELIDTIKTALSLDSLIIKKITMISSNSFTFDINALGIFSDPFLDADANYKISIGIDEVVISSCVIHESGVTIWVAIEF